MGNKKRTFWMTSVPSNVPVQKVTVNFKLDPADVGRPPNDVMKIDDAGFVNFISVNSAWNGLICCDRIVKVNEATGKKCLPEILKGDTCSIELFRRQGAKALMKKPTAGIRKGHCVFSLEIEKAANMTTTSVGCKLALLKKRAYVVQVDPNMICSQVLGRGDAIVDIEGEQMPMQHADPDNFFRDRLAKLSTGRRMKFLVERACNLDSQKETLKYLDSIYCIDTESEIARDVIDIGREASNLHFLVLRKLTTPSIWRKVRPEGQNKQTTRTIEEGLSTISISTASTEMKIQSDVENDEELKKVTSKSHAASAREADDGVFDDE